MPDRIRLYEDLDALFTKKMQLSLLTGEKINMPDWIDDMAAWIAEWIGDVPQNERARMLAFSHERLDYHVRQKGMN